MAQIAANTTNRHLTDRRRRVNQPQVPLLRQGNPLPRAAPECGQPERSQTPRKHAATTFRHPHEPTTPLGHGAYKSALTPLTAKRQKASLYYLLYLFPLLHVWILSGLMRKICKFYLLKFLLQDGLGGGGGAGCVYPSRGLA
jgi:hypothetical protein